MYQLGMRPKKNPQKVIRATLGKGLPFSFVSLCLVLLIFLSPASLRAEELKKISFVPQWVPQAQFAGYYVAADLGIYRKYGLDVEILPGGPEVSPAELLKAHKATFANMGLNTAIQEFAESGAIVNIAQIVKRSALMFVAKKTSGIKNIQDINHRKVGVWNGVSQVQSLSFLKKHSLTAQVVPQSSSLNLFLRGAVDVASAMWYNEYYMLLDSGYDPEDLVSFFFFNEPGLNFPEDGIYTLAQTFNDDPALCCAFARATIEGWSYAFSHPQEALGIVLGYMRKAHIPASPLHQKWMLERMRDIILSDGTDKITGDLSVADYQRVASSLREFGFIKEAPDFNVFTKRCVQ